ncbi:MAG: UvrD-helicase domain-containing protein, partial [Clostridia bacterium]|nr:UvrD-helicase domain-containing protein [Clostridia bacterium]
MKKRLIIKEGMLATYNDNGFERPVFLCDVKRELSGISFNARDKNTNALIRRNTIPIRWDAYYAITNKCIIIEHPEFTDEITSDDFTILIDFKNKEMENLRSFFINNVKVDNKPYELDDEQLDSVLINDNTLVTARAGSGKTRTLVAKLIYLFEKQNMNKNNVLAFCFNRDAKEEINKRLMGCEINNQQRYQDYDVASTFHSFALNCLDGCRNILDDNKSANKTTLIKDIIDYLHKEDKKFSDDVYNFFRGESLRVDRRHFNTQEAYYQYIRNSRYTTLNNEKVKYKKKKYIADFLFEY